MLSGSSMSLTVSPHLYNAINNSAHAVGLLGGVNEL